jgi:hypothetical protein
MLLQQLKQAAAKLLRARLAAAGFALHRLSLGAFIALSEADPLQTYMESGPSLFCSCCGERWHAFSHAECPNGCPWVYTSFRAPAWAEDAGLIEKVQRLHQRSARRGSSPAGATSDDHVDAGWPTADGRIPRA